MSRKRARGRPAATTGKGRRRARRDPRPDEVQRLVDLYRGGHHRAALEAAEAFTGRWPDLAVG